MSGGTTATAEPVVAPEVTELLVALSRARRWLSRLATHESSPVGASGVSALAEVIRSGPLRLGDLAAREGVAPATLSRARRWLSRLATDQHSPVGASGVSALAEVIRSGPLRLGDLAAAEGIAPSTLTRLVTVLEERGYVERCPVPGDARASTLTITPAGHEVLERIREQSTILLAGRLRTLTDEQRAAVAAALPALEQLADPADPRSR